MMDMRSAYRVGLGDLREIDHLEFLGVDWMMIIKRIFKVWDESMI